MNPIDNPGQRAGERAVIELWKDQRIQDMRALVGAMWKNAWEDALPAQQRPAFDGFVDEHVTN